MSQHQTWPRSAVAWGLARASSGLDKAVVYLLRHWSSSPKGQETRDGVTLEASRSPRQPVPICS